MFSRWKEKRGGRKVNPKGRRIRRMESPKPEGSGF
jgi:hypothetical protein